MIANCVMYSNPIPKVYQVLPPPWADFEEVLAFLYIGSEPPTSEDFSRMLMLVRRNQVRATLEWLMLRTYHLRCSISEGHYACGV